MLCFLLQRYGKVTNAMFAGNNNLVLERGITLYHLSNSGTYDFLNIGGR